MSVHGKMCADRAKFHADIKKIDQRMSKTNIYLQLFF